MSDQNEPASNPRSSVSEQAIVRRVIFTLLLLFALILGSRIAWQGVNPLAGGDSTWQVTYTTEVELQQPKSEIHIAPLRNTAHARVYGQHIYHPQLRQKRSGKKQRSQDIVLVSDRTGKRQVIITFDVHLSHQAQPLLAKSLKEDARDQWLQAADGIFVDTPAVITTLTAAAMLEADAADKARFLFEHVSEKIAIDAAASSDGAEALAQHQGSSLGAARALVSLLRSAHLPARVVTGIDIQASQSTRPHYWVEAYYQGRWHTMDVARQNFETLPRGLVPVTHKSTHIALLNGTEPVPVKIHSELHPSPHNALIEQRGDFSQVFNLLRISPDGREALALLILLPICILVTEFFRQIIGVRTFGTFTPSLLALAGVYAELATAVVVFSLVILLGVAGRSMLPRVKLSRVPRLSIVFTMVAGIMVFAVSALLYFDPGLDAAVVLLPTVVLTSLVDRFYTVADEQGLATAVQRLWWTVTMAAISLLILLQHVAGFWLLQYPECHLLTIVMIIVFGRYRGKRLVDVSGFHWIAEPVKNATRRRDAEVDR